MRALIVEDEPIFRMDLSMRLKGFGFQQIDETAYAEDAIATVEPCAYDLVLMDVRLKGKLSGLDAAQQIASSCGSTPIMIMSAYQLNVPNIRTKVPTLVGFAPKPISDRVLRECVDEAVRSARERDAAR